MRMVRYLAVIPAFLALVGALSIAGATFWLNSFIHSEAFRHEVEARVSAWSGRPVEVRRIGWDLVRGMRLEGLKLNVDAAMVGGVGLLRVTVPEVDCHWSWSEVLHRRLELTQLTVKKPEILFSREREVINFPPADKEETTAAASPVMAKPGATGREISFQMNLSRVKITGGSFVLQAAGGASVVQLQGLRVVINTNGNDWLRGASGNIGIAQVNLAGGVEAHDFKTPFGWGTGGGSAGPFEAKVFGGHVQGLFRGSALEAPVLEVHGNGLQMGELAKHLAPDAPGLWSGSLDFQSRWGGVEAGEPTGGGDVEVIDGKLAGMPILEEASQVLGLGELAAPRFSTLRAHFTAVNRQAQFTGVEIDSKLFQVTGSCTAGLDKSLNGDAVLMLSPEMMQRLPGEMGPVFALRPDGSGSIGFHIGGTWSEPETDFPAQLMTQGRLMRGAISKQLDRFLGGKENDPTNSAPEPASN